ncbi:MAG: CARDB domain-containing protein, partial [Chloroflexota bacterium]
NQAQRVLNAMRFQNNAGTGTLSTLELLLDDTTPSGRVRLGVYADSSGRPGSLLLDAGEVTVSNGWVAISQLDLPVTQGAYYWLAFNLQDQNRVKYQSRQPARSHCWLNNASYGALPGQFNVARAGYNGNQYVMRATVTLGASAILTLDPVNTPEPDDDTSSITPQVAFSVGGLSISPTSVRSGQRVTISALVTNSGDAAGSYEVVLKINGVTEGTQEIALDAGQSQEVTFTTQKDTPGSYAVDVNGANGSFQVISTSLGNRGGFYRR